MAKIDHPIRPRRLRQSAAMRALVAETRPAAESLVYPYFIREGRSAEKPITSMPGISQFSADRFLIDLEECVDLGLNSILLFGIPAKKDATGRGAWDPRGPVPSAIRAARKKFPGLAIMADVCLCEYTSHGHCGPVKASRGREATVENDAACALYAKAALAYADAGADIVAPSGMMDGMVGAIRSALDDRRHDDVAIMAYSVKYASHFYGPFRDAAESPPQFGDRRTYQMDPANVREARREMLLDAGEGADIVMVKPALAYLDVIRLIRASTDLPIAAYNVSGEYSMVKAAIAKGWLAPDVRDEILLSMRRAGADILITYFAKEVLRDRAKA